MSTVPDPIGGYLQPPGPRPAPVDHEPGARLGKALSLLEDVDRAAQRFQPLLRSVERMTGLPPAQVSALLAFAESGRLAEGATPEDMALAALAAKGLVTSGRTPPGVEPEGKSWRLTDTGGVTVEQVQGLRIRALDTLASTLSDRQIEQIQDALRGIGDALASLQRAEGADEPRSTFLRPHRCVG